MTIKSHKSSKKLAEISKITFINLLIIFGILTTIEGVSSFLLFWQKVNQFQPLSEEKHTQYDGLLGWANIPNINNPNLYGPGIGFQTNSQGFRNNQDFSTNIPPGKLRIICSGDSFTMGWGVSNDQTWCEQLVRRFPNMEGINMGQGGYGIDQAYLWYQRDGVKFDHNMQIFAFINNDFARMTSNTFTGYPKPLLFVENGQIVNHNYPVSKSLVLSPKLREGLKHLQELQFVQLWQSWFPKKVDHTPNQYIEKSPQTVLKIFEDLQRINQGKNSQLVLVYLPSYEDYSSDISDFWVNIIEPEAKRQGIIFINLISEFKQKIPPGELDSLFLQRGHYSVKGNTVVADMLYEKLQKVLK